MHAYNDYSSYSLATWIFCSFYVLKIFTHVTALCLLLDAIEQFYYVIMIT